MKIEDLIDKLEDLAYVSFMENYEDGEDTCLKAAETIKLLWEVVRDTNNEKYKMQFDEWRGNDKKICDTCKHGAHPDGVVICDRDAQRHERNEVCSYDS